MWFSAPVKKHWLGSFSIVLPPSGLRGFVPVVRAGSARGGPGGGGGGRDARARILDWYLLSPKSETPISFCQPAKAQDQPIKLDFAGVSSQRGNALDAP